MRNRIVRKYESTWPLPHVPMHAIFITGSISSAIIRIQSLSRLGAVELTLYGSQNPAGEEGANERAVLTRTRRILRLTSDSKKKFLTDANRLNIRKVITIPSRNPLSGPMNPATNQNCISTNQCTRVRARALRSFLTSKYGNCQKLQLYLRK